MKKPTLVLWDWNGTLFDDLEVSIECLNLLLQEYGYPQRYDAATYKSIFGFPIEAYYQRAGFDFLENSYENLAARYIEMFPVLCNGCPPAADAASVLAAIHSAGIRQAILSASPNDILIEQVAERNLSGFFEELLGLSDIYAKSKTARGIEWIAASGIDPDEIVMIGDTDHDAEAANAMGVRCILCAAGHQSHQILSQTGCTVIDSLAELPALLGL